MTGRGHRAGGGVRHRRHVHRHPRATTRRTGCSAAAGPRPTPRSPPPTSPPRWPSGRGCTTGDVDVAPAPSSTTCPRRAPPTGSSCSALAAEIGYEIAVRDGKFDFGTPTRRPTARTGGGRTAEREPAGAAARHRPAAVPRRRHLGRAGQGGRGPRLGHRHEAGARRDRAGRRPRRVELPDIDPAELAKTFGDPVYVATDVPYRTQAEVDARRGRARRGRSPARSPSSRAWPGATRAAGGRRDHRSTTSARRSTASTPSPPRATARPDHRLHHVVRGHRRQDRSLFGLAGGGGAASDAPAGRR